MKKSTKQRNSNFELLRIVSMFLIVVWHVIVHSQLIPQTNGVINIMIRLILIICSIHVNSFVIVTGYFQ